MSLLKKNIIANYLGQGWTAIMGLAFVPLYIEYLGMEAYGLIGLFAAMQAWLSLLDMGITPTLNREMALYSAGTHSPQSICNLLRSLEVICFSLAVFIAMGVWVASGYLASDWLQVEKLPIVVVTQAISVMAFVVALRFVEGIYRGSLFGLQRQVWFNGANVVLATLRHGGAMAVLLWVSPTIQAFFFWQALISLLAVVVFAASVHRTLPKPPTPPKFSREAIAGIWKFASGMLGITFLATLLTQVDKVLLSRLLTLESFGYYILATVVAGVLSFIIGSVLAGIDLPSGRAIGDCFNCSCSNASQLLRRGCCLYVVGKCRPRSKNSTNSFGPGAGNLSQRVDVGAIPLSACPWLDKPWIKNKFRSSSIACTRNRMDCSSLRCLRCCVGVGSVECWICYDRHSFHASPTHPERKGPLVLCRRVKAPFWSGWSHVAGATGSTRKLSESVALVYFFIGCRWSCTSGINRTGRSDPTRLLSIMRHFAGDVCEQNAPITGIY